MTISAIESMARRRAPQATAHSPRAARGHKATDRSMTAARARKAIAVHAQAPRAA